MTATTTKPNVWGLVGTGRIARERILPGILAFTGNKLGAVVSRDKGRAEEFASQFGAERAYTSFADMLDDPAITVVAIETPNNLHAEQAIAAARAGKHVFCDKPLATNAEDARSVVEECDKAGVKLGVNFHNRFMPCFIDSKAIIDSGEIGDVLLVEVEASAGARPGGMLASWRVDPAMAGMGTAMTVGVHVYDIMRYLLSSEVAEVTAIFDKPRGSMEEIAMSILRFANGVIAHFNVNEIAPNPRNDFVIYGSKGRIVGKGLTRSRFPGELFVLTHSEERSQKYDTVNAHAASVAGFSRAIAEGRTPDPSGIDGLRSAQLTDAMARSAYEGVHVRMS